MQYLTELIGGKRNQVELYRSGSELIVKKIIRRNSRFDFYSCERDTLLALKGTGLAPEIIDFDDDDNVVLYKFVEGRTLRNKLQNPNGIAEKLAELHNYVNNNTGQSFSFRRDPKVDLTDIVQLYERLGYGMDNLTTRALEKVFSGETTSMETNIHGSLIPTNIVVNNGDVTFIDFEMASRNNPFLDLAYLCALLPEESSRELQRTYIANTSINNEEFNWNINYARYHICGLTLALFMENLWDPEISDRARRLKKFLEKEITKSPDELLLTKYFSGIVIPNGGTK
jgi:thiamine kinase-like enzyme